MKIDGPNRPKTQDGVHGTKVLKDKAKERPDSERTRPSSEKVDVSASARALQTARAPEVPDQEKITRLRDAIAKGEFKIDVSRIADRIMEEEF